jgi:glycerate kinase
MRVVIASDSFKGSLSSAQVAAQVERGFKEVFPDWTYVKVPVADGGEGTVEAMVGATGGRIIDCVVAGPLGKQVKAFFGLTGNGRTAVIEMAAASGMAHLRPHEFDPMRTTTFGVGELIRAALDHGARHLIVGIGGSATNDGGAGMLQALGVRLLDNAGRDIGWGGEALASLITIDCEGIDARLAECEIEVACDVENPLVGPNGASSIFGPQKGATPLMVDTLEANLRHYADCVKRARNIDVTDIRGGGAAGGLGAAMAAFLDADLRSGAEIVAKAVGLEELIEQADLVITGEGRIDEQTLRGKIPFGVAGIAARFDTPVVAFCGSLGAGFELFLNSGADAIFSIVSGTCSIEQALERAAENVRISARNVAAALQVGGALAERRKSGALRKRVPGAAQSA